MSETTQDDTDLLEYIVAGLVVTFFGCLYYWLNPSDTEPVAERPLSITQSTPVAAGLAPAALSLTGANNLASSPAVPLALASTTARNPSASETSNTNQAQLLTDQQTEIDKLKASIDAADARQLAEIERLKKAAEEAEARRLADLEKFKKESEARRLADLEEIRAEAEERRLADLEELRAESEANKEDALERLRLALLSEREAKNLEVAPEQFESELGSIFANKQANTPVVFDNVEFETGSAALNEEALKQIGAVADQMKQHPDIRILIRGHSDNVGPARTNTLLSLARSGSMKNELLRLGIHPSRVEVEGVGPLEPIAPNTTEAGRQQNRRIELIIIE